MRGMGNLPREMHRRSEASEGTRSRKRSPEGAARRCAYANQRMTLCLKIGKTSTDIGNSVKTTQSSPSRRIPRNEREVVKPASETFSGLLENQRNANTSSKVCG